MGSSVPRGDVFDYPFLSILDARKWVSDASSTLSIEYVDGFVSIMGGYYRDSWFFPFWNVSISKIKEEEFSLHDQLWQASELIFQFELDFSCTFY